MKPHTPLCSCALLLLVACGGSGGGAGGGGSGGSSDANLSALTVSTGVLDPVFAPATTIYDVGPGFLDGSVRVTPTTAGEGATVLVDGIPVVSGSPSQLLALPVGPTPVDVVVTAADGTTQKAYTLLFDRSGPSAQVAYVKASNTGAGDRFGHHLSLSGDTLAVGAPIEASNATGVGGSQNNDSAFASGAVYVFVRSGGSWTQQAYLKASNAQTNDAFGMQVSLSGDTLAVSAPTEDSNAVGVNGDETNDLASNSGAVYVFVRSGGVWTQQAYLKASNAETGDFFGAGLSLSGDTLVAAAPGEDGRGGIPLGYRVSDSGAAYVFVRSGTTWSQQAYLRAANAETGDYFGGSPSALQGSVALSGDTVVVGALAEDSDAVGVNGDAADNSAVNSGAAYVFVRNGTVWSQQAYLKASNTEASDEFGFAVAVSGDTVVVTSCLEGSGATGVGGNQADNSAAYAGAAYVFVRNGTTWAQQAYVKATNAQGGDSFGFGVALSGDTLVVTAEGEDSSATGVGGDPLDNSIPESGAAYVYARTEGVWTPQAYMKASNPDANDGFGCDLLYFSGAVSISDGTIVVGAPQEDSMAVGIGGNQAGDLFLDSGAVYVFR